MTPDEFWKIIELGKDASQDTALRAISKAVKTLKPEQIVEFQRQLDEHMRESYTWGLWGAAYVMMGGCSDDGFEYFRAWLISRGRAVFEAAVKDPESLAALRISDPEECEFESLMYVPAEAYEAAAGEEMPPARSPHPAEPSGKPWKEDDTADLARRYPRLWKKHGHGWSEG